MAKQYTFDTFIEAGDFLKRRYPQDENLAQLDVESAGIKWAEAYPDAVEVIEAERQSSPRATFPYQPAEGHSLLKTIGNIPYSAGMMAGDVASALLSPVETAEGLARTAAGAVQSLALPGAYTMEEGKKQPLPSKNVEMFEAAKEGFRESISDRGVQERPLDAISNALILPGLLAKLGKVGLRGMAQATAPKTRRGVQPEVREVIGEGSMMPEDRLEFPSPKRAALSERLSKGAEILERGEKMIQSADPAVVMARGAKEAVQRTGRAGADVAKRTARIPVDIAKAGYKQVDKLLDKTQLGDWVRKQQGKMQSVGETALTKIQRAAGKTKETGLAGAETMFGERPELGGTLRGLLEQSLGFTFGLGPRVVKELIDISSSGGKQSDVMLDAIRQKDEIVNGVQTTGDAIVSKRIMDDLNKAVRQYAENQSEIHRQMREPLQLNRVVVDIVPLRRQILENLPEDIKLSRDGSVQFGPFFTETGRSAVTNAIKSIFSVGNNAISLQDLDKFKGLIDEMLYESTLSPESRSASALRNLRGATSEYIKNVADDPVAMNAQIRSLREKDIARALPGMTSPPPGSIGEAIPPELLEAFTDDAIVDMFGRAVEVGAGEYSAAMRQYFDFQDNMDRLNDQLRLERPQTRTFATGDVDPATGQPVKEEVLRQRGKDIETLRAVLGAFDEDTGLALETLRQLSVNTKRPELISQIIGALHRPALGGGLVVRSEISQAGRAAASGVAHPIAMVTAAASFLPSLALFSPKYGGQVVAYMFSPDGKDFLNRANKYMPFTPEGRRWIRGKGSEGLAFLQQEAPDGIGFVRRHVAARKNKRPDEVTPDELIVGLEDYMFLQDELAQADKHTISALRDFYRYGAAQERMEEAGGRREERQNLLQQLGQMPQTPSVSTGGLTPQAR
tara:strand:+ start:2155 stop:4875 length:2721 start_codon:yes stop_codon:yes gene_type:complete